MAYLGQRTFASFEKKARGWGDFFEEEEFGQTFEGDQTRMFGEDEVKEIKKDDKSESKEKKKGKYVTMPVNGEESSESLKIKALMYALGVSRKEAKSMTQKLKFSGTWEVNTTTSEFKFFITETLIHKHISESLTRINDQTLINDEDFGKRTESLKSESGANQLAIHEETDRRLFKKTGFHIYDETLSKEKQDELYAEWVRIRDQVYKDFIEIENVPQHIKDIIFGGEFAPEIQPNEFGELAEAIRIMKTWSNNEFLKFQRSTKYSEGATNSWDDLSQSFESEFQTQRKKELDYLTDLYGLKYLYEEQKAATLETANNINYEHGDHIERKLYSPSKSTEANDKYERSLKREGLTDKKFKELMKGFVEHFENKAVDIALNMLYVSQEIIKDERNLYSSGEGNHFSDLYKIVQKEAEDIIKAYDDYDSVESVHVSVKDPNYIYIRNSKQTYKQELSSAIGAVRMYKDQFPILADKDLDIVSLSEYAVENNEAGFRGVLLNLIDEKMENIQEMRSTLKNPDDKVEIWKLDNAINAALLDYESKGMILGDLHNILIQGKLSSENSAFADFFFGILSFLAALTGPFTGGAGFVASAIIGGGLAVSHFMDYQFQDAASNTAFDQALSLSNEEPSFGWLVFDIALTIVDITGVLSEIRAIRSAVKTFVTTSDASLTNLRNNVSKYLNNISSKVGFKKGVDQSALTEKILQQANEFKIRRAAQSKNIDDLEVQLLLSGNWSADDIVEQAKVGLAETMNDLDRAVFNSITKLNKTHLNTLGQLLYKNPKYAGSLNELHAMIGTEKFDIFIHSIGNFGPSFTDDLLSKLTFVKNTEPKALNQALTPYKSKEISDSKLIRDLRDDVTKLFSKTSDIKLSVLDDAIVKWSGEFNITTKIAKDQLKILISELADWIINTGLRIGRSIKEIIDDLFEFFKLKSLPVESTLNEVKKGSVTFNNVEQLKVALVSRYSVNNITSIADNIGKNFPELKAAINKLVKRTENSSDTFKSETAFFMHRLDQMGTDFSELVILNKQLNLLLDSNITNDVLGKVLWSASSTRVRKVIAPGELFNFSHQLVKLDNVPINHLSVLFTKLSRGQISKQDLSFLVETLSNKSLSKVSREQILSQLESTSTPFSKFREGLEQEAKNIDEINEILEGRKISSQTLDEVTIRGDKKTTNEVTWKTGRSSSFRKENFASLKTLGVNIPEEYESLFQAHHIILFSFKNDAKFGSFLEKIGFRIDDGFQNGLPLLKDDYANVISKNPDILNKFPDIEIWQNMPKHLGSHSSEYGKYISEQLSIILETFNKNQNAKLALRRVENLVTEIIDKLETGQLKLNK